MSLRTYPAFCSLNQSELELLSMPVQAPADQAINLYPIFDEIAWHESLMVTLQLFEQFLSGAAPHYSNTTSSLAGDLPAITQQNMSPRESSTPIRKAFSPASGESSTPPRETVSPEGSYAPTHELTGPVRSKRAEPRVVHACDECRNKKKKVRSSHHPHFRTSDDKAQCSGEQPLCLSCQKAGRVCTWTPIKTSKNRPCLNYGVAKLCRPPSYTSERDSMTRQLHIAAPKPTYPIKLKDMQGAAILAAGVRNPQAASSPLGVGFPAQIATRRTRAVDFNWSDLRSSDFSQECIPLPPSHPPYFGNVLSPVHSLHMHQRLRNEDIYRRALAGQ
ncbi:hypothetical protein F4604DRAFT_1958520 [Suillus subluteus]|nr:hypothetical protein F4604DRAFT_1958520 [Suillus subluteus]